MATASCRQPAVLDFPPTQFNAAFIERRMRAHREWQEERTAELAAEVVSEVAAAIGVVDQVRIHRGAAQFEALPPRPLITHEPDPIVAPDAGQFLRVELLDHIEECSDENCRADTRLAVSTHEDPSGSPYCAAHVHVAFADWMVGA
jgi:hypothetical protein